MSWHLGGVEGGVAAAADLAQIYGVGDSAALEIEIVKEIGVHLVIRALGDVSAATSSQGDASSRNSDHGGHPVSTDHVDRLVLAVYANSKLSVIMGQSEGRNHGEGQESFHFIIFF